MTYGDIFYIFSLIFSNTDKNVKDYRPQDNEANSIHIWMKDGRELVFTYNSATSWYLETYEHYKDRAAAV